MSNKSSRTSRRRRVDTRPQKNRVLVVSGGRTTEAEYLKFLKKKIGPFVAIDVVPFDCAPKNLLSKAEGLKQQDLLAAKRSNDAGNTYDAVWIVCDVDDFANQINEIRGDADQSNVMLAISNPCFEIWLYWHGRDWHKNISTKEAQKLAKDLSVVTGKGDKNINLKLIEGRVASARARAEWSAQIHIENNNSFPRDNPSSGMSQLVSHLETFAKRSDPRFEIDF